MNYLLVLVLILLVAWLMGEAFERLQMPAVVGQLVGGFLLGPAVLNWVKPSSMIATFAELGVIVLMFLAGLESDLNLLKKYFKPSIVVAVLGIALPVISIYALGRFHALSTLESLFIGVIFAATSVSISVAVLKEMHALNTDAGVTILGAAVADDILSVLLLSAVVTIFGVSDDGPQLSLPMIVGLQVLFFLLIWGLYYVVKKFPIHIWKNWQSYVSLFALLFCLLMSGIAEDVQLSAITGAFFAGIIVSQTEYRKQVTVQVENFGMLLFVPIFFVNVGLNMQLSGIMNNVWLFIDLSLLAIITKFLGAYEGSRMFGFDHVSAAEVGAGMISRGEVGLIIAEMGLKSHLISENYYSTIIAAIVITTIVAPLILRPIISIKRRKNI
ncbi:cation:proton antiporter [Apilactobacillus bombintestini]|uniref:Cation:proton antiporter n=1 Tax=Apilactobacillus bombintestini TaxID=2419772 RepID=A0A387ARF5_9LACO|nr:cation:proton antiporter [Apilactobacillus bombintestini]AYF92029.1 cation:proton antiporter [Apilactobacillus bombintestini]